MQEQEVQRLLQSWFKTTYIVSYNNISAGHTSLPQVYRCYSNICKPEEDWYGQPKYCYKKQYTLF